MVASQPPRAPDLAAEIRRAADHLRRLPEHRLARRPAGLAGRSSADAAHDLAQWLADAATSVSGPAQVGERRLVPRLSDLAVGDQVAVTGAELVAATAARGTPDGTAAGPADRDVDEIIAEAMQRSATLRRLT